MLHTSRVEQHPASDNCHLNKRYPKPECVIDSSTEIPMECIHCTPASGTDYARRVNIYSARKELVCAIFSLDELCRSSAEFESTLAEF